MLNLRIYDCFGRLWLTRRDNCVLVCDLIEIKMPLNNTDIIRRMVDASKNIKNKISSQKQNQTSLESGKSSRAVVVD